jgi:hypothetical protein
MYLTLTPVGMVEVALAEQITLTAWRQRRVTRFETESMRQALEETDQHMEQHLQRELNDAGIEALGDLVARAQLAAQNATAAQAAFDKFLRGASGDPLTNEEAVAILTAALAVSGRSRWPEDAWMPGQPSFQGWTAALVYSSLECLNRGRRFRDLEQFTRAVGAQIACNLQEAVNRQKELAQKRLKNRRASLLLDGETCERVMRYEAHLARRLHRDLRALMCLQAARSGRPITHEIAIDIDVAGGAKSD